MASNGAVVTAHPIASKVGLEILKLGGNAVDAAIATQLALAVVYPAAGNLGGGGFLVAKLKNGVELAIDYREKAPGKAHADMYLDPDGTPRTDKSQYGHLSAGVPGTVAGLCESHRHAKLPFRVLIEPAIRLAENGFVISRAEANSLNALQEQFRRYNTQTPAFVRSTAWKAGDTLVQKDLAETLKRIRDKGKNGFYRGKTARLIVEEMKRGRGIISYKDLKNYRAVPRDPHSFEYKGHRVISMGMPSSGGVLLHQMMKMIEDRNLQAFGFHSPEAVHLMAEVERRAFADRAEHMGDMDFYKVPVADITNEDYLRERMSDFNPEKASISSAIRAGSVALRESQQTTHLSVVDKEGNAVAVTITLNNSYGSKTVVGGAGFLLNDEMDDFSIKPGVPNLYGAVGSRANAIEPGKRMLSSMTPTIVLKNGEPYIIVGTPGGTTIPTSVFQALVNILEFGLSAEDAVYRPKFHHQWQPDVLTIEKAFPADVRAALEAKGHKIREVSAIGRTELIVVHPGRRIEAIADIRGEDSAEGY